MLQSRDVLTFSLQLGSMTDDIIRVGGLYTAVASCCYVTRSKSAKNNHFTGCAVKHYVLNT